MSTENKEESKLSLEDIEKAEKFKTEANERFKSKMHVLLVHAVPYISISSCII